MCKGLELWERVDPPGKAIQVAGKEEGGRGMNRDDGDCTRTRGSCSRRKRENHAQTQRPGKETGETPCAHSEMCMPCFAEPLCYSELNTIHSMIYFQQGAKLTKKYK